MPSINLIAARRAEKRRLEQRTQRFAYGIAAEAGLVLIAISTMVLRLVNANSAISDLDYKMTKLQGKVTEIQGLQQSATALQPKLQALTSASGQTLYWFTALQNIAGSLPKSTWLSSVGSTGSPLAQPTDDKSKPSDTAKLNIQGYSMSQFAIGEAMLAMNMRPTVSAVQLNFLQVAPIKNVQAVNFQMVVTLRPEAQPDSNAAGGLDNAQKS